MKLKTTAMLNNKQTIWWTVGFKIGKKLVFITEIKAMITISQGRSNSVQVKTKAPTLIKSWTNNAARVIQNPNKRRAVKISITSTVPKQILLKEEVKVKNSNIGQNSTSIERTKNKMKNLWRHKKIEMLMKPPNWKLPSRTFCTMRVSKESC